MKKIFVYCIAFLISSNLITAQTAYTPVDADSRVHFTIKNFGIKTGGDFAGL